MAGAWRTISVALTANTTGYTAGLRSAAGQTKAFESQTTKATDRAGGAWRKLGIVAKGTGLAIGLAMFEAGRSAVEFEARMRNVNSISGLGEQRLANLSKQVIGLSRVFPQSANTLAEGLYEIASSGFQGAKGMTVLTASAKAASAGLTTTDNAAKAITATLNAYGLEASDAQFVSDALFQTVNLGVVNFEELTGVIGDVVGTAAAAGQGIDEVGQAIATMTLSGISASESGTSLNRLLQAMIDPSDALKEQFSSLGYESGALALEQDGLAGVVDKLTGASEGNIETLLKWFPEIRAARGALALMNNEGAIYKKTIDGWAEAHSQSGATQRAFAEQMKSTKAQLTLLFNGLRASGIELGTKFLPYIQGAIDTLQKLGSVALPFARDRFEELGDVGENLRAIIEEIVDWAGEAAMTLGEMGGGIVLGALAGLTTGLANVSGFLADHPVLIRAITSALIVLAAVKTWDAMISGAQTFALHAMYAWDALASSRVGTAMAGLNNAGRSLKDLASGAQGAGAGIKAGLGGAVAAIGPATVAIVAITAAVSAYQSAVSSAKSAASDYWSPLTQDIDTSNINQVGDSLIDARDKLASLERQADNLRNKGPVGWTVNVVQNITPWGNDVENLKRKIDEGKASIEELERLRENYQKNTKAVRDETGLTNKDVEKLANQVGVNLTDAYAKTEAGRLEMVKLAKTHELVAKEATKSGLTIDEALSLPDEELQKIVDATAKMDAFVSETGLLGPTVTSAAGMTSEAFTGMADDAQKFIESVGQSFADYGNIVGSFGDQTEVTGGEITKFYDTHIAKTEAFSDNVAAAVKAGYDPQLIARVLQAGPEQAAPFLESLVANQSDTFVGMVNNAEDALRDLNQQAVEMARLTNIAIEELGSDGAAKLDEAMKISQTIARLGGEATADELAKELGMGVKEVAFISALYGIALKDGINPLLAGIGAPLVQVGRAAVGRVGGTQARPAAEGGYIDPAEYGDTHRDSVPAVLMPGEVVVRRDSVRRFGTRNLLDLNAGRVPAGWKVPGFASGGMVQAEDGSWVRSSFYANSTRGPDGSMIPRGFGSASSVPKPPDVSRHGNMVGKAGAETMAYEYAKVVDYVKKMEMALAAASAGSGAKGLDPKFLANFNQWNAALGNKFSIGSGWRSSKQQAVLYDRWLRRVPGQAQAAPPGRSNHEKGLAIDHVPSTHTARDEAMAGLFGLKYPMSFEPWHIEPMWAARGGLVPYGSYDRGGYLPKGLSLAYNGTGAPEPVGHGVGDVMVKVYIGNQQLDGRIDYRVGVNNERVATELRKGRR
jgi:TP901 family phage tail tape measure protein